MSVTPSHEIIFPSDIGWTQSRASWRHRSPRVTIDSVEFSQVFPSLLGRWLQDSGSQFNCAAPSPHALAKTREALSGGTARICLSHKFVEASFAD